MSPWKRESAFTKEEYAQYFLRDNAPFIVVRELYRIVAHIFPVSSSLALCGTWTKSPHPKVHVKFKFGDQVCSKCLLSLRRIEQ